MKVGKNVRISDKASIYNTDVIEIGDNVRVDDFCILSGGSGLKIGSHIHISAGCKLYGGAGVILEDFVEMSVNCSVFSQSDDFSGRSLVGPCIPKEYKPCFKSGLVLLRRHVLLGAGVTILPGVEIGFGSSVS